MQKICYEWDKLLKNEFKTGKYWKDFKENALAVTTEIKEVKSYEEALPIIRELAEKLGAKKIAGIGGKENPELAKIYNALSDKYEVYTDKFDITKNANTIDIGITVGEFGVGETGSICVDNYSYEARLASMLPPMNMIFMKKNYIVNNMQDAFNILEKVFDKGYTGFVTGPSRTSDIERVLTLGVHGPSRVILFALED